MNLVEQRLLYESDKGSVLGETNTHKTRKKTNKQTAGTTTERQPQNRQTKHKNKTKILEDAYMQDMK